jgi:hypothetical protein
LSRLPTFEEKFEYLKLDGQVAHSIFGGHRYLNQAFYQSDAWRKVRRQVILRDNGCDLGMEGREINSKLLVHHINPITPEDLIEGNPDILDPNNLVCVSENTHQMLHYGNAEGLEQWEPVVRKPNDTCPWKS